MLWVGTGSDEIRGMPCIHHVVCRSLDSEETGRGPCLNHDPFVEEIVPCGNI